MGATDTASDLDAIVDRLRSEDLSSLSPELLGATLVGWRSRLDRLEAEWTRRVAAFDAADGHNVEGHTSTVAFLKHRCRMAASRAQAAVILGHRLSVLLQTENALVAGELSLDQARVVASIPERLKHDLSRDEAALVNGIGALSVADTRRLLAYWQSAVDGAGSEIDTEAARSRRYFYLSQTFQGMVKGDFLLDPAAGEVVMAALSALTPSAREGEERSAAQRRADALVDMAHSILESGEPGRDKPHLMLLTDAEALRGRGGGIHETCNGTVLAPGQIRQVACDCALTRLVFGPASQPIDLGRTTRVIPSALARAVIARDRHCQHPGCDRPARWCDIHHLVHWADGGPTNLTNLILLCRYHHTLRHRNDSHQAAHHSVRSHGQQAYGRLIRHRRPKAEADPPAPYYHLRP